MHCIRVFVYCAFVSWVSACFFVVKSGITLVKPIWIRKIDLLLKEFQEVKLRLDSVEQLNEEATNDHRPRKNDYKERRYGSTDRHRDDDDITYRSR